METLSCRFPEFAKFKRSSIDYSLEPNISKSFRSILNAQSIQIITLFASPQALRPCGAALGGRAGPVGDGPPRGAREGYGAGPPASAPAGPRLATADRQNFSKT